MKSSFRIVLDDRPGIAQAAALKCLLMESLAAGHCIIVDGSQVAEIDTATLQLLLSLWRSCAERQLACRWEAASQALLRAALLLGVAELLQLPGSIGWFADDAAAGCVG